MIFESFGKQRIVFDVFLGDKGGLAKVNSVSWDITRKIKQNKCFLANDYGEALEEFQTAGDKHHTVYNLPDGSSVTLNEEAFQASEILLRPILMNNKGIGLHELAFEAMMKTKHEDRRAILENICLCGGSGDMTNIDKRLLHEIHSTLPGSYRAELKETHFKKQVLAWTGGTIVSSMTTFKHNWVDREMYQELGSSIIARRCF